jgi:cytochrome c biogenesis protein CcmG/thiol:disulfide interchange protein DsbE
MRRFLRSPILHLCVVSAFVFIGCNDSRRGIYPGEIAPDVEGVALDGSQKTLHSIQGKVLLVNFWATWCAPCMEELPALEELHKKLTDKNFQVVGIAIDDALPSVREAVARFGVTFPIIVDESGKSKRKFQIKGLPESFVLDQQHKIVLVRDPADGNMTSKIVGPRMWSQNQALQVFSTLVQ